jgi:hypothetical protein
MASPDPYLPDPYLGELDYYDLQPTGGMDARVDQELLNLAPQNHRWDGDGARQPDA